MNNDNYNTINDYFELIKTDKSQIAGLYKKDFVNWRGSRSSEDQYYSDYIAKKLLTLDDPFSEISKSDRHSYFVETHDGVTEKHTNRTEEIFAKSLLRHQLKDLGKVIGYQMPLKEKQSDTYGKVDLVSFREDDSTAFIIELKMADKKETLLRAALEIETYHQIIKEKKLKNYLKKKEDRFGITQPDELKIKKAVLFALNKTGTPKELLPKNKQAYKNLWDLLSNFEIGVFTIPFTYPTEEHKNPNE